MAHPEKPVTSTSPATKSKREAAAKAASKTMPPTAVIAEVVAAVLTPEPIAVQPPKMNATKPEATKSEPAGFKLPDPAELTRSMGDIAERSQRLVTDWLSRQGTAEHTPDPLNIGGAFMEMTRKLVANPARLVQAQLGCKLSCVFFHRRRSR